MPESNDDQLLILIDGHAVIHRAWHAIQQPLNVSSSGEEVRAVYGFLNTFLKTISDWNPSHCAVAFDLPAPTFRHQQFPDYKAHRPHSPPELRSQFGRVKQLMSAFQVPIFEYESYEGDDILGTLSSQAEQRRLDTIIVTGDTDTLQLVNPWVKVLLSTSVRKRALYDELAVSNRYGGLQPNQIPEIKALEGDSSDNIPGVPGIGSKTAIKLLSEYGSIQEIYENIHSVTPSRFQNALLDHKDQTFLSKDLATIVKTAPVELDTEESLFWKYDRTDVVEFLRELEFYTSVPRIPIGSKDAIESQSTFGFTKESMTISAEIIDSVDKLTSLAISLTNCKEFAIEVVATSEDPFRSEIVGLAFATNVGETSYIPMQSTEGNHLESKKVFEILGNIFGDYSIKKVFHNSNFPMTILSIAEVNIHGLAFDTLLASHFVGKKAVDLSSLVLECFQEELPTDKDFWGSGRNKIQPDQMPIQDIANYYCKKSNYIIKLRDVIEKELSDKGISETFINMEMKLSPIIVKMQYDGLSIDSEMLTTMSSELADTMNHIQSSMYQLVGHEFNLNSSQQLGGVLFDELRLPKTKKTQKGYSTDASSLEQIKELLDQGKEERVDPKSIEVLNHILHYRQVSKIKSTYVDALPNLVNPATGRIHTNYNQAGSSTGRVSSNNPNVQNIPVRTELGRKVRKAFVAKSAPDWLLVGADYSQIELRILAHMSKDPGLTESFQKHQDIHSATASSVYGVSLKEITPEMRRVAKIINFGVLYGLSAFGISRQTDLSAEEGAWFIKTYFSKYPGIKDYIESTKMQVRESKYVETLMGRRRYIHEIDSSNYNVRAAGERMAVNMPIQGTAADILKIAMIRIQDIINQEHLKSIMILQVHDELIFEVPSEELSTMRELIFETMASAMELDVPLEVEMKSGYNWDDMD